MGTSPGSAMLPNIILWINRISSICSTALKPGTEVPAVLVLPKLVSDLHFSCHDLTSPPLMGLVLSLSSFLLVAVSCFCLFHLCWYSPTETVSSASNVNFDVSLTLCHTYISRGLVFVVNVFCC